QRDAGRDRGQGQERVLEPDQAPELAPRRAHQRQEPELLVARAQEGAARVEDEEEREDGDEHEADRQHVPRDRAPVEVAALHVGVEQELRVDEEERDRERAREQEGGVAQPAAPEVAERELRERHDAKPPIALRVSSSCWKNAWRLPPRLSSVNARPSLMNTTRRQKLAANGSWVTMTTVTPCSSLSARRACITSFADLESRLPVSSSASTTAGAWTMARAIAARCCWPPATSEGVRASTGAIPSVPATRARRAFMSSTGTLSSTRGRSTFSRRVSVSRRLKSWKTKPRRRRRKSASCSASMPAGSWPPMRTEPDVGVSIVE